MSPAIAAPSSRWSILSRGWAAIAGVLRLEEGEPAERFAAVFGIAHGALIWLVGGRRPAAAVMIVADLGCAVAIVTVLPRLRRMRAPVPRFLGVALPLLLFYLFYLQTALIDVSAVHWRDAQLAALQRHVLSRVPVIGPLAVRDWFLLAYLSYVAVLAASALAIFIPGDPRSQRRAADAVRRMCYALAVCYVVGLLFPALSPRFVEPRLQLDLLGRGFVGRLAAAGQKGGMVAGSSFPSAHVAAVTTVMWDLWHARRPLFWLLLPWVLSMVAGTVLFLFHYVPDVAAGFAAGAAALAADRWRRVPAPARTGA